MNNWYDMIATDLKDAPVGASLNVVLKKYEEILNEFYDWIAGRCTDENIIYAEVDTLEDGYNLYAQCKKIDCNKTFHFSILNGGNLVLIEENNLLDEKQEGEIHEFGFQTSELGFQESYYHYSRFVEHEYFQEYDEIYDQDGNVRVIQNDNTPEEEVGYTYQR